MKKKTIACLIAIVMIASVVLFVGCVEKEESILTPAPKEDRAAATPKPTSSAEQPKSTMPTTSSTGDEYLLQGTLCHGAGSYRAWITFDGQGRFTYGSETTISCDAGMVYSKEGPESGTYKVVGDNIPMTFGDGTSIVATVYFRQDDGRITEIYCGNRLYGTGLC